MHIHASDLKEFYETDLGHIVRRRLRIQLRRLWPDVKDCRVMGLGYATPYLKLFQPEAERIFAIMPAHIGVHSWPQAEGNLVATAEEAQLPIESNSVERILWTHGAEYSEHLGATLEELWRVMTGDGRMLMVVPSRIGLWSRSEVSPFGHGHPYTIAQIKQILKDNRFTIERQRTALFFPPSPRRLMLSGSGMLDRMGAWLWPAFAGVHVIEVSKQVFAPTRGSRAPVKSAMGLRPALAPKPSPRDKL